MRVTALRHELNRLRAVSGNNFTFDIKQARADSKNKRNVQQAVRGNSSTSTSGSRSSLKMKVTAPQHELNQNTSNSTSCSRQSPKMRVTAPRHELNRLTAVSEKNFSFDIKQELVESENISNCTPIHVNLPIQKKYLLPHQFQNI
jgi:hypothetical protein